MSAVEFNPLLDDGDAGLHATMQLGAALKAAKDSALYRFLMVQLDAAADAALAAFLECNPADVSEVAKHQARLRLSREMPVWVEEQINRGLQAQVALTDRFEEDLPRYVPETVDD